MNLNLTGTTSCRSCAAILPDEKENFKFYYENVTLNDSEIISYGEIFLTLTGHSVQSDEPLQFCLHCAELLFSFIKFRSRCHRETQRLYSYKRIAVHEVEEQEDEKFVFNQEIHVEEVADDEEMMIEEEIETKIEVIEDEQYLNVEHLEEVEDIVEVKLVEVGSCPRVKPIQCEFCKSEFLEGHRYVTHLNEAHEPEMGGETFVIKMSGALPKFRPKEKRAATQQLCPECGIRVTKMKTHMETYHNQKEQLLYRCEHCGASRTDKNKLRLHILSHTKPRVCEQCGAAFANSTKLRIHMQRNHGEGVIHQCNFCDYQTRAIPYLRKHIRRKHEKVRPKNFKCEMCECCFYGAKDLEDHKRRHYADKNFHCSQCPAAFKTRKSLVTHQAVHQDYKYECPVCERTFLTNQQLRIHVTRNHKEYKLPPAGTVMKKGYEPAWMKALKNSICTKSESGCQ